VSSPATQLNGKGIRPVPGLDDVARDARCASGLPKAALLSLLLRTAAVQSCLTAQLAAIGDPEQPATAKEDRMLDADEAATLLHKPRRWLFEHKKTLPFVTIVSRKVLLCSEAGLKKWMATRRA
jgi:hypothetical protein